MSSTLSRVYRLAPGLVIGLGSGVLLTLALVGSLDGGAENTFKRSAVRPNASSSVVVQAVEERLVSERSKWESELAVAIAELEAEAESLRAQAAEDSAALSEDERAALGYRLDAEPQRERERRLAELAALREELAALKSAPAIPRAQRVVGNGSPTLAERARSAEVAVTLGPYLEPGFAQLDNTFGDVKRPFSFSELDATGALNPTLEGWRTLHQIARSRRDTARTRWAYEPGDEGLQDVQIAQQMLRDLGPTFVDLGMMRP
jgi:hypothetical protein